MKIFHVYGTYYNWTTNRKQAKKWKKDWNGTITIEKRKSK